MCIFCTNIEGLGVGRIGSIDCLHDTRFYPDYDHDNLPLKIIQGYKLNIFYPDLVDKSKAPTYTVEKDGNRETCIIRFHAGLPYEDIVSFTC